MVFCQDPKHEPFWKEMWRSGVLKKELVDDVFSKVCRQDAFKEDILNMMEQFGLIVKFESSLSGVQHFVPSQLRSPSEDLCKMEPSPSDPCPLYIHFPSGFVPHGLYSQLVSRCIKWCSENRSKVAPVLHDMACCLFITKKSNHQFILICKKRFIKIVLKQTKPHDEASLAEIEEVAILLRRFLEDTLQNLPKELPWLRNLQYELCVGCPYCREGENICFNHGQVSCPHEDCMCVPNVSQEGQPIVCPRSGRILTLPSLEKWFSTKGKVNVIKKSFSAR